ncbi:hypothetical protein PILCRDRAFT_665725 [Piloderma croceum F 1598]|uniref:Uncharacterized protein n=1 Tax=Piloderma croceum (strain F 1598) TaxID=765440 RepID=A0A0C3BEQ7_PILCF|nr:hypothetical protein PILCRDRAFT_665725 [Piloderma croceum F 1598]
MSQLLRDGVLYFIGLFLAAITNVIIIKFAPALYITAFFSFYRCLAITFCSRLMLNLRGILLRPPLQDADDTIIANMSALVFSDYPQDATATVPSMMEDAEGPEVESYRLEYMQASMVQNLRTVGIQKYWQPNSNLTQV